MQRKGSPMPLYEVDGKKPQISPDSYVHPDAVLIGDVTVGRRTFIAPGVVIRADEGPVIIGDDTSVQDNAVIHINPGARVVIGNEVIVGHSVILHDAHVHDRCVIGMGAILLFGAVCEEGVFVAAGSVVPYDMRIPAGKLAAGNPAKVIKDVTEPQKQYARFGIEAYLRLVGLYRDTARKIT